MNTVRPWRLLGAGELRVMQDALAKRVLGWQDRCLLSPARPRLALRALQPYDLQAWPESGISLLDGEGKACAQLAHAPALLHWLQEQAGWDEPLAGKTKAGQQSLVRGAGNALLESLLVAVAGAVPGHLSGETLSGDARPRLVSVSPCSGDVSLFVHWGEGSELSVCICLAHALVTRWCEPLPTPRGGLSPRQLPAHLRLPYRVLAGEATLALSALMQMEAGDVLQLEAGPGQGLRLESASGSALCRAGLGLDQGRPALQLCAALPLPHAVQNISGGTHAG